MIRGYVVWKGVSSSPVTMWQLVKRHPVSADTAESAWLHTGATI